MSKPSGTKFGVNGEHVAVLIDGDNISSKVVAGLMTEVANYGTASVRRIYGDWSSPQMRGWRDCLLEYSIIPIQQYAYTTGKNATDTAMIIDAMDLLYTGRFSSFCLVSSDSDFTRLAARIREQGIAVYGFGNRHNTHRAFVAACNHFVYFDAFHKQEDETVEPTVESTVEPSWNYLSSGSEDVGKKLPGPFSSQHAALAGPKVFRDDLIKPYQSHVPHTLQAPSQRPLDQAAIDAIRQAISRSSTYEDDFVNLAEVAILRESFQTSMLEIMDMSGHSNSSRRRALWITR